MKKTCPTCGQEMEQPLLGPDELYRALQQWRPHRQVYHGRDGGWFVSYVGGQTTKAAIDALLARGLIAPCYSDTAEECFHIGKTVDVEATMAERKLHRRRKDAPTIFTDGSRELRG